jgi:hypothetical protein
MSNPAILLLRNSTANGTKRHAGFGEKTLFFPAFATLDGCFLFVHFVFFVVKPSEVSDSFEKL